MRKTWIISDEHYFHNNIISFCNRPFENYEEMNEKLIRNHNLCVKNGHLVMHLGDFCLGGTHKICSIIERLNGDHVLILGNHDSKSVRKYLQFGFVEVYKYPVIIDDFYILSHRPVFLNGTMPYVNVHGHTHCADMELLSNGKNMYYNVSCEKIGYKPIDLNDIKDYYK